MTELELEARLRAWYRTEVDDAPGAPLALRSMVDAIPRSTPRRASPDRRVLLIAAAFVMVGLGAALAAGSGFLRVPTTPPVPPSVVAVATPAPVASPEESASASTESTAVPASPVPLEPGFRTVADMSIPRWQHSATLLEDGRVLIAGGSSVAQQVIGTSELWDPATESFAVGQSMLVPRFGHKATLLRDGRVVIIGGWAAGDPDIRGTRQIEIWDPATEQFRAAGFTAQPRDGSVTAVLLADGRVLIISGVDCGPRPHVDPATRLCEQQRLVTEVWDPDTEVAVPAGATEEDHDWASAALLDDGRVFVLGYGGLPTVGAEVWNPASGTWSRGGAPVEPRMGGHTVTHLLDGRVLVVGGQTGVLNGEQPPSPLQSINTWDPTTSTFSPSGPLAFGRERHAATLLPDGRVLFTGGVGRRVDGQPDPVLASAEIWDPTTGLASDAGVSNSNRALHTATLLADGRILVTGGFTRYDQDLNITRDTASAEVWGR
jgi:hypothetical protein